MAVEATKRRLAILYGAEWTSQSATGMYCYDLHGL